MEPEAFSVSRKDPVPNVILPGPSKRHIPNCDFVLFGRSFHYLWAGSFIKLPVIYLFALSKATAVDIQIQYTSIYFSLHILYESC
jgi:hypothetical protein